MATNLIANTIAERIKSANKSFRANDNISEFIKEGELDLIQAEVEKNLQSVLEALVIDTENDHNTKETARRVAKMYIQEIFAGRYSPMPKITSFPNLGYKSLYTAGPISIKSTCAHHFQPIVGKLWVGVLPEDEVIGLSKFNRIAYNLSERPQIQEELTSQIAQALSAYAKTPNIATIIQAEHHCIIQRGVKEHESIMTTAVMLGAFDTDKSLKSEFYKVISLAQNA